MSTVPCVDPDLAWPEHEVGSPVLQVLSVVTGGHGFRAWPQPETKI